MRFWDFDNNLSIRKSGGKHFIDLQHLCNPFAACEHCAPRLQESGWQAAHDAVGQLLLSAVR